MNWIQRRIGIAVVAIAIAVGFGYAIRAFWPSNIWPSRVGGIQPVIQGDPNITSDVDPARFQKVSVVLQVKYLRSLGADKYAIEEAAVLRIFKNFSGSTIGETVKIASYSGKRGIPHGVSTVYLEPYSPKDDLWKLFGGDAVSGASHMHIKGFGLSKGSGQ